MLRQTILSNAYKLGLFALVTTGLLALLSYGTAPRIQANIERATLDRLDAILPASRYNNDILQDTQWIQAAPLGHKAPSPVYIARQDQQPVAAVFTVTTPRGYSGDISLLIAVNANATVAGVRVIQHKETPGLGDKIERRKSDWIEIFNQRSLSRPGLSAWRVKKDGGEFDQFTGATITPRAVVAAVADTLAYFEQHQQQLFTPQEVSDVQP